MATAHYHILSLLMNSLTLLLFLTSSSSSSSSSSSQEFQVLDVASSLSLTRLIFSAPPPNPTDSPPLQLHSNSSFSLPLHPRHHLFPSSVNNYTALTLSRLAGDLARVNSILSAIHPDELETPVISGISQGSGEYFTRIGVGEPAKEFYMVLDSGSDVTWLQCDPCINCYQQSDPVFNPATSSTYQSVSCSSSACNSLQISACNFAGTCLYQVSYGDGSRTVGEFATETISFGRSGSIPGVAIGCGHDNEGLFSGAGGLIGLGGGSLSFPSQIRATSFSYCLVDRDSRASSTLDFNNPQPPDSVQAPLLTNSFLSTYRYVALTGISVGGSPVRIPDTLFDIGDDGRGGVIVDSGTVVTRLRSEVYNLVRDSFKSMSRNLPAASGFSLFDTCYDLSAVSTVRVPTMSFQFAGGKTLPLTPKNYLIPVSGEGKFCFAFAPSSESLSIIGSAQQQGTRVSYNLDDKYVGFGPHNC